MLLLQESHLGLEQVDHVPRGLHLGPVLGLEGEEASAQLQSGHNLGGLGLTYAPGGVHLPYAGPGQAPQPAVAGQEPGGQAQGTLGSGAGAQDDGHQLGVAQRRPPQGPQPLPGSLGQGQVSD